MRVAWQAAKQEKPGGARNGQRELEGPRKTQKDPGGSREPREAQEDPGLSLVQDVWRFATGGATAIRQGYNVRIVG